MAGKKALSRHDVRYWCFRFRTATDEGGASAVGAPPGLRKKMEANPYFGGWEQFGVLWDVSADDPYQIVPLRYSLEMQWNTEAMASSKPWPGSEE